MNLTRRQQEFIRNLLDLYRETKGPIHYTTLAERVGVSQITAYDMLRLLEKKGFVRSDYQLASDKTGPGRSAVVFWPSQQAHQRFAEIFQELGGHDWETFRERFLEQISCEIPRSESDRDLVEAIFAYALPDGPASLQFCAEIVTVITLRLQPEGARSLLNTAIPRILPDQERPTATDLNLFGGFILGLLTAEQEEDDELNGELIEHMRQYYLLVAGMDLEVRHRLAVKLVDIVQALTSTPTPASDEAMMTKLFSNEPSRFGVAHDKN